MSLSDLSFCKLIGNEFSNDMKNPVLHPYCVVNVLFIALLISQKNKRDFLVFVILGALTSFVGGTTAVQSMRLPHNPVMRVMNVLL